MWVRIIEGRNTGKTLEVDDAEGRKGIRTGVYARVVRHERAVRDLRETADV